MDGEAPLEGGRRGRFGERWEGEGARAREKKGVLLWGFRLEDDGVWFPVQLSAFFCIREMETPLSSLS